MTVFRYASIAAALYFAALGCGSAQANDFREKGKPVTVAHSPMIVTPPRDWNRLDAKRGKFSETWTLDGEQLNEVTFYGGVEPGAPLVKESDRKHAPLPKFTAATLLVEIPELLEGTYRADRQIKSFAVTGSEPSLFLGRQGIRFTYDYTDNDELPRKGEARAVLIGKKLFMITFDAPRLHFFDSGLGDFRSLAEAARLPG